MLTLLARRLGRRLAAKLLGRRAARHMRNLRTARRAVQVARRIAR